MDEGNAEFWYAYNAYHQAHVLPSFFASMSTRERAIVKAFIDIRSEKEEKESKKAKRQAKKS